MINESRNKIWQRHKIYDSTMIWMHLYKKEIIKTKLKNIKEVVKLLCSAR